jgi:predicted SnoaL-like aldol condensation-catalyzing enzyme
MKRDEVIGDVDPVMRAAAEEFFRKLYIEHDFVGAMRGRTRPGFVEHNSHLPNDPEDQIRWFEERAKANPDKIADEADWNTRFVHKFIVPGYLIVHYFMSIGPTDRGRMFADFWNFDGDKLVEHWDVVQEVPEKTESGNPMW